MSMERAFFALGMLAVASVCMLIALIPRQEPEFITVCEHYHMELVPRLKIGAGIDIGGGLELVPESVCDTSHKERNPKYAPDKMPNRN
jgi:hypothetical protein